MLMSLEIKATFLIVSTACPYFQMATSVIISYDK